MAQNKCGRCRLMRKNCHENCIFAPYFPANDLNKFACLQKIFGSASITKILTDLDVDQRETAVTTLVYEAKARIDDAVQGCVRTIYELTHENQLLKQENAELKEQRALMQQPLGLVQQTQNPTAFLQPAQVQRGGTSSQSQQHLETQTQWGSQPHQTGISFATQPQQHNQTMMQWPVESQPQQHLETQTQWGSQPHQTGISFATQPQQHIQTQMQWPVESQPQQNLHYTEPQHHSSMTTTNCSATGNELMHLTTQASGPLPPQSQMQENRTSDEDLV
ncbi:LOB domain-containing protein 28-like [Raphanus sativus]|uniref:LOB domain-containing protein 12-like n=1 Tax=Raphanus sativus TaxID=3726 RepID=A0A6J0LB49_RAPSA|nr:LOB domain-containing protein 12-like [Raphanus sativus]KAJ4866164.1 LOB domain-containing protein 28-like [Raphanus sativus]